MITQQYALNFSLYPTEPSSEPAAIQLDPNSDEYHTDPSEEVEFDLLGNGTRAFVSGSWGCWGPNDQESDGAGDGSLRILVYTDRCDARHIAETWQALDDMIDSDTRLGDYGIICDPNNWSEETHIFTFDGHMIAVHEIGRPASVYDARTPG